MVIAKIGFIGSSAPSSPHLDSFRAFAPKDVDFTFVQEVNPGASLWDARGKLDSLIAQVNDLIERHEWNGRQDEREEETPKCASRHGVNATGEDVLAPAINEF